MNLKKSYPVDKQLKLIQYHIRKHYQVRRKLRIDTKRCTMLLKSRIYRSFTVKHLKIDEFVRVKFTIKINKHNVHFKHYKYYYKPVYLTSPCFGYRNDGGSFANQISRMKYLSEFLGVLPSFVIRDCET